MKNKNQMNNAMNIKYLPRNKELKAKATALRKNATPEENKLWYEFFKEYSIKFTRQRIIGNYIVDFYCDKAKLIVELDGSQHFEDKNIGKDNRRTAYFESLGLYVLRFANNEINESFYEVCTVIDEKTQKRL